MLIQILNTNGDAHNGKVCIGDATVPACEHSDGRVFLFKTRDKLINENKASICPIHSTIWALHKEHYRIINKDAGETEKEKPAAKTTMQKISLTLKRILNPEMQAMYKAGLITDTLELTEKGKQISWQLLTKHFEKELAEEANKIIEEEKDK